MRKFKFKVGQKVIVTMAFGKQLTGRIFARFRVPEFAEGTPDTPPTYVVKMDKAFYVELYNGHIHNASIAEDYIKAAE